jgi:SAM-dependent methyltransferase
MDYTYPDFFARFYDVIYNHLRNEADHDYFMNKFLKADGPVLEVGVGTGRFFIEALNKGANIYGIDFSPTMIDVLKKKLPEKEHFRIEIQNICNMQSEKKFYLIVAPFRVIMHLLTIEEQLKALNNMYFHLIPGGRFIFDLFVPNLKMLAEGVESMNDFTGEYEPGKKLQRFTTMHADPVNQISHVTFKFVWQEEGRELSRSWSTSLKFFFRHELEHLLFRSDFKDYKIFGDFAENDLAPESKEFVVICTR